MNEILKALIYRKARRGVVFCISFSIFILVLSSIVQGENKKAKIEILKLGKAMKAALNHSCLKKGEFGVKFYSLERKEVLFQHREKDLFVPASNVKLITTAVARKELGA